ncbi:50S ribosomal protein L9 [Candidatus Defluviicoccus seviourii]|uniref:Large ribosomal subunit protein bL9 n=2 Tax=root TaxID=1 RepID=A0A564WIG2_9PROT|nr:50S ribosomal protein L9 [uncultured Defluviicoccus sp.]VUX47373.1 50S ribosomal protein L9 [Candidatus Defluviicoccus seviourii]
MVVRRVALRAGRLGIRDWIELESMMELILLERIEKLGKMGEVVRVRPGYARNYLLPQKKAVRATEENRKQFEEQRAHLEALNAERRTEAEGLAGPLQGVSIVLIRQSGEAGQLYGSVSTSDIADAVSEAGVKIRRQQVLLNAPIKAVGLYEVPIALHPEVSVTIKVSVARSRDEAETQLKTGTTALSPAAAAAAEEAREAEEAAAAAAAAAAEEVGEEA